MAGSPVFPSCRQRSGLIRAWSCGQNSSGYRVELKGKGISLQTSERIGNVINSVVGHGERVVSAGIYCGELIVGVELLGSPHVEGDRLAMRQVHPAGIGVDDELRFDQVAMVLEQPVDSI